MREYKDNKLVSITCNSCSEKVDGLLNDKYEVTKEPFREFKTKYGYGSELFDFHEVSFDICERCLYSIMKDFEISPKITMYDWLSGEVEKEE